tara:strand:+ start:3275 stop:3559 length:285 start_codon:yes stop_codon:yes gene_type:complete
MTDKCALEGMIRSWSLATHCDLSKAKTCDWCGKKVCNSHSTFHPDEKMRACDECRALNKIAMIDGIPLSASNGLRPMSEFIVEQYMGMTTKRAK